MVWSGGSGDQTKVFDVLCKHSAVLKCFPHVFLVPSNSVVFAALTRTRWDWRDDAEVKSLFCFF